MMMRKERLVRVFNGKHLSFRGQKVKVKLSSDLLTSFDFSFGLIVDRSSPTVVLVKI